MKTEARPRYSTCTRLDGSMSVTKYHNERMGISDSHLIISAPDLLKAAKIAEKFYVDELKEIGGCDHQVNICVCHILVELETLRATIVKAEGR